MYFIRTVLAITATALLVACTWVKTSEEARTVALVKPSAAQQCEKLATTTSKVADNIGPIPRGESKVQDELIDLAKNEAALIGGDSIVAEGAVVDGVQRFSIYRCAGR